MNVKWIRWTSAAVYAVVMIAGWFYPVVALAAFVLMGSVVLLGRRKTWCGRYCPRGSFLDMVMKRVSPKRPVPRWMTGRRVWLVSLGLFVVMVSVQVVTTGLIRQFSWSLMGVVMYRMCFVTSMVALPLAVWKNHRAWCSVCPVGNLLRR